VAARAGGALETVLEGQTGLLATVDDAADFARAVRELDGIDFRPQAAVENAERFSVERFRRRIAEQLARALRR
jgi:glycosyltransferase involved in cell wall biosynthesis